MIATLQSRTDKMLLGGYTFSQTANHAANGLLAHIALEHRRVNRWIDTASKIGGVVLVHCAAGCSRSVTVCCAYLMHRHGLNAQRALDLVRKQRPVARPNSAFIEQLAAYNDELERERTRKRRRSIQTAICETIPEFRKHLELARLISDYLIN